jgi:hypothetical protein
LIDWFLLQKLAASLSFFFPGMHRHLIFFSKKKRGLKLPRFFPQFSVNCAVSFTSFPSKIASKKGLRTQKSANSTFRGPSDPRFSRRFSRYLVHF